MKYDFPIINHIDDVLPAIEGRDEFVVAERDGYKVINYNVNFADTFGKGEFTEWVKLIAPPVDWRSEFTLDKTFALRRECRGIIFDSHTGEIVRRPYHKFFNVGEREETQPHLVDLSQHHYVLDKLDGSMIAPFYANGELIWGTKMGDTDVAKPVQAWVRENSWYIMFANELVSHGWTPIFEWCSRKQRIVIDHPEDRLILTAIRNIVTGDYMSHDNIIGWAKLYGPNGIPVVDVFDAQDDIQSFIEHTRGLQDCEGFVVRFVDGHMVKLKCDWYVQIHKAKEAILQDRNIVELILDEKLDDIKPHLLPDDLSRLEYFEGQIICALVDRAGHLYDAVNREKRAGDRKHFAQNRASEYNSYSKAIIFSLWDNPERDEALKQVKRTVRNNLTKNVRWDELREHWFSHVLPYN